jgi:hemerythrin-like domain-containing protein
MLNRRTFLSYIPAATACAALFGAKPQSTLAAMQEPKGTGAIETLMRGHGLLLRAVLVYSNIRERLEKGQQADPALILKTVAVIQDYLEGFHEKAEETYIFAPMENANVAFASIQELKVQHGAGFELTQRITALAKAGKQTPELAGYLDNFVRMYVHHASWEDTVVFPAFDAMHNRHQLDELAAILVADERKTLGKSGFQTFVDQIASVEKQLGIYELSTSTPHLS